MASEDREKKIGTARLSQFPLPVCVAGKCGAVNRDGTYAVAPLYNHVDRFIEGRAAVRVRDGSGYLYGYVDETGRVIAEPLFPVADRFSRGYAQIDVEGKSGLIDREGRVVIRPRFGFIVSFNDEVFWATEERDILQGNDGKQRFLFDGVPFSVNGVSDAYVIPKGHWGLVDRSGTWIRRPEFLAIRVFDYADSRLMWAKTDAGWGLLRPDLSWQVDPKFQQVGSISDGLAVVALGDRWGFVDTTGRVVIAPSFDYALDFSGLYAPVRQNKLFGLIDRTGAWAVEPKYAMIHRSTLIPKSWWPIKAGEKYGLLDDSLREVISPQLDQPPAMCTDGRILGFLDKKWKLFSHGGTPEQSDEPVCDSMITAR